MPSVLYDIAEAMSGSGGCVSGTDGPVIPATPPPGETPAPDKTGATGGTGPTVPPTAPPTVPAGYQRPVILIKRHTSVGQDLFIRGGISHDRRAGE